MALDAQTETRVVALIARGDTYQSIQDMLAQEGVTISLPSLSAVKKRNSQALSYIQSKIVENELNKTTKILDKSRTLLEQKLDSASDNTVPKDLIELHESGMIDDREFFDRKEGILRRREISIRDLTSVSKEMFNQSQLEANKPTSITNSPEQAKQALQTLLSAINSGKAEDIAEAVFIDA